MNALRHGLTPKMRAISPRRSAVVCALDIGTSKIVCVIARLRPCGTQEALRRRTHLVELLGIGHTRARGIKAGAVVNLAEAEAAVRQAVDVAERMAKVQVDSLILSVSAGRMRSELYAATVHIRGSAASEEDIKRVLAAGSRHSVRDGRVVLHSLPVAYALDETRGIRDPRGMLGQRLGVDMHVVTTDGAFVRNLMFAVERCHLDVEALVAAPYVAGLCALADDEADLGAAVIDIGAGSTTLAVFSKGRFVYGDAFALGGNHITADLARGLGVRMVDAERVKNLHGSALADSCDERDMFTIPRIGEDEGEPPHVISRAGLVRIIGPRAEEILEMARDRLAQSPFATEAGGRVVLTGGSSQLAGLPELAGRILDRQVRVGRPLGVSGLPAAAKGPAFTVAAGLLIYPQLAHLEQFEPLSTRSFMNGTDGYFARMGRWLRESF